MDIQEKSKELHEKARERISKEKPQETADRIKDALSRREEAMKKVHDYQEEHGVPSQDEVDENFLKEEANIDVDLEEFRDSDDEPEENQ